MNLHIYSTGKLLLSKISENYGRKIERNLKVKTIRVKYTCIIYK